MTWRTHHFVEHADCFVFVLPVRAVRFVITEGVVVYASVDPVPIGGRAREELHPVPRLRAFCKETTRSALYERFSHEQFEQSAHARPPDIFLFRWSCVVRVGHKIFCVIKSPLE